MLNPFQQKIFEEVIVKENNHWTKDTWYSVSGNTIRATLDSSKEITIHFRSRLLLVDFVAKIKKDPLGAWKSFRENNPIEIAYTWEGRSL